MTIEEAMGIAAEMEAIGTQIDLLSNGHALVTLAAEVRRLRNELAARAVSREDHERWFRSYAEGNFAACQKP